MLTGGAAAQRARGRSRRGYYVTPTVFEGHNAMRIFQEEIFGPVVAGHLLRRRRPTPSRSPTTRSTASVPASGRVTARRRSAPARASRPVGVDELLPRLPGARGVRRLQTVRHRSRDPQDDARPLPADQEPAGVLHDPNPLGFSGMSLVDITGGRRTWSAASPRRTARSCSTSPAAAATSAVRRPLPRAVPADRRGAGGSGAPAGLTPGRRVSVRPAITDDGAMPSVTRQPSSRCTTAPGFVLPNAWDAGSARVLSWSASRRSPRPAPASPGRAGSRTAKAWTATRCSSTSLASRPP